MQVTGCYGPSRQVSPLQSHADAETSSGIPASHQRYQRTLEIDYRNTERFRLWMVNLGGKKQAYENMLPAMQHLSLLSKTMYDDDCDISSRLSSFRTHLMQVCGLATGDGHDTQQHFAWAIGELSDLNEIMVTERRGQE